LVELALGDRPVVVAGPVHQQHLEPAALLPPGERTGGEHGRRLPRSDAHPQPPAGAGRRIWTSRPETAKPHASYRRSAGALSASTYSSTPGTPSSRRRFRAVASRAPAIRCPCTEGSVATT